MATVIADSADLQNMKLDLTDDYELAANIDCSDIANFEPVGGWNGQDPFTGTFDGKGFRILNLVVNRAADDYIGLFGYTNGATLQNVIISTATMTGDDGVAVLIGYSFGCTISQCAVAGTVTGDMNIGGLIGYSSGDILSECSSDVAVTGDIGVGGLVGYGSVITVSHCHAIGNVVGAGGSKVNIGGFVGSLAGASTISDSYATGDVTGDDYIGGFVGFSTGTTGLVRRCYATGDVTAITCAGGFIGNGGIIWQDCFARGAVTATVDYAGGFTSVDAADTFLNCYSTGAVAAPANAGGFCGADDNGGTFTQCFWDTQTSGQLTSQGGTGKTTTQMQNIETFSEAGWAISRIWAMSQTCNDGYPCLIGVTGCCPVSMAPAADPTIAPKKVSLELIRNLEIMNNARSFVSKEGDFIWESRFHRG